MRHKLVQTSIDEGLTVEKVSEAQSHLCNGWENVCEAIVAEAAKGLDTHFTELQMEGCNITSDEYDLWEEAHVASYRAVNMASFGAMEIFMQAVSEWAEMCDLFDPDWEDHDWWYADEEE
ncbi:hypothetical protein GWM83_02955 [Candidatus Bathyarchaeota archaeon]|nr:hypothetical protein [Candidatus Bathyarchaeota archaeon]NIR16243.1 hypothetical protein [Desulfobacterales bacterium]NIW34504.1 hypothetical protein [Candidatus Bathyarchaeota archaeon]